MLSESIVKYENVLNDLETALERHAKDKGRCRESEVFRALIARDDVAAAMTSNQPVKDATLSRIIKLDRKLKRNATTVYRALGRFTFEDWRDTVNPPDHAWWWSLDEYAANKSFLNTHWKKISYPTWIITIVSLSFIIDFVRRYFGNAPDIYSTVVQGLLALTIGTIIYQGAKQFIESKANLATRQKDRVEPKQRWVYATFVFLAVFLGLIAITLLSSLPTITQHYSDKCRDQYYAGLLTKAVKTCECAARLDPDDAVSHYNLGSVYESLFDYDRAISEYQNAIFADNKFYAPYINLARLYLLRRNDSSNALNLLYKALPLTSEIDQENQAGVLYTIYRNVGWANFNLKYYKQAEESLRRAIGYQDGAEAHCLLAQVLEAQNNPSDAMSEWKACIDKSGKQEDEVELNWLSLARERLRQGEKK